MHAKLYGVHVHVHTHVFIYFPFSLATSPGYQQLSTVMDGIYIIYKLYMYSVHFEITSQYTHTHVIHIHVCTPVYYAL